MYTMNHCIHQKIIYCILHEADHVIYNMIIYSYTRIQVLLLKTRNTDMTIDRKKITKYSGSIILFLGNNITFYGNVR